MAYIVDKESFKKIFDTYYLALTSFGYRYVNKSNVVDDFIQDAFVKLWERHNDFNREESVKSFLYVCVRNSCIDYIRKHKDEKDCDVRIISCTEEDDEIYFLEEEVYAMIYDSINGLSKQTRKIIRMTMEGYTNTEISSTLNISKNTVKTIKLRAYRILRDKLKGIYVFFLPLFLL